MTPEDPTIVGLEDFIILSNDKGKEPAIDSEAFNALKEKKHVNIYNKLSWECHTRRYKLS